MTEIALREASNLPVAASDPTGGRLIAWAEGLAAAHRIGSALCTTAFVPRHFQNKPDEAAAAILFGDEVGLSPTQALRSIHVISGTPGLYAKTMVALVQSRGHEVWTEIDTAEKVVVCGKRKGTTHVERSEWTVARARKAGYTTNKKYETDPQSMLYARAASDVCRKVAADALAGLSYSSEELEMEESTPAPRTITRNGGTATKRTVARQTATPEPAPEQPPQEPSEPPLDEPSLDEPVPVVDTSPDPVTRPQLTKMHAAFGEMDISDRAERLGLTAALIQRDLGSANELTKGEATRLIDMLEQCLGEPDSAEALRGLAGVFQLGFAE